MIKAILFISTISLAFLPDYLPNLNKSNRICVSEANNKAAKNTSSFINFDELNHSGKSIKEKPIKGKDYRIKTIVIDPGHGGHDPGCLGSETQEKHLALAISRKFAKAVQSAYPHINVVMTRTNDSFIPLHQRADLANRNEADLFISIHCNYIPKASRTKGSETYVLGLHRAEDNLNVAKRENASILLEDNYQANYDLDPNSPEGHIMLSMYQNVYLEQSILFAQKVENKMAEVARRKSRGVKQAGFVVLRKTTMPSVLIEAGFLSNSDEEEYLKTREGQQQIAKALFEAFREYKMVVELGESSPTAMTVVEKSYEPISFTEKGVSSNGSSWKKAPETTPESKSVQPLPQPSANTEIQFRVQLAASPSPLDITKGRWTKVNDFLVEVITENNLFKYQARDFNSFQEAERAKNMLKRIGFEDAFVVAYQDGRRVRVSQARKRR